MTLSDALREYDPEWGRSFATGRMTAGGDHLTMLEWVKVPVLFTHHFHQVDEETGHLLGASSDVQVAVARRVIEAAGQPFTYRSLPDAPHSLHGSNPELYASLVDEWIASLQTRPRIAGSVGFLVKSGRNGLEYPRRGPFSVRCRRFVTA